MGGWYCPSTLPLMPRPPAPIAGPQSKFLLAGVVTSPFEIIDLEVVMCYYDNTAMSHKLLLQTLFVATMLVNFCGCASPSKERRVADGKPSAGAQIGKGAVNGLRYVVGVPVALAAGVAAPLGGGSPLVGLEMLEELHRYEPSDSPPEKEENSFFSPP